MPAYKDEARGTWYCRFRYVDYTGQKHETTKRGFKTKKAALQYEQHFKQKVSAHDITWSALCDAYLQDRKANQKPNSYASTEKNINIHVRPAFGNRLVESITKLDVRRWHNDLKGKSAYDGKQGARPYAASTINLISSKLVAVFQYAVKYYDLKSNPARIAIDELKTAKTTHEIWSVEEFNQFLAAVDDKKLQLCYLLLFYSGMRMGELLALAADDFDFEANSIRINKNYVHINHTVSTPKTAHSVRTILMPPTIMAEAHDYLSQLMEKPERVFAYHPSFLRKRMTKFAALAGVKRIRPHDLRHSHASLLIHNRVPITTISQRLGHSNPSITLAVYSHMYNESAESVAALLETAAKCGQTVVTE